MMNKIRSCFYKYYIGFHEKIYQDKIRYLYFPSRTGSNQLLVTFSAFPGMGKAPNYNYVRSFKGLEANRLYILDDAPNCGGGSYYLGNGGNWYMTDLILSLIENFRTENTILITNGSSKGGTAAIFYGLRANAEYVAAGACQYFIGKYLNCEKHIGILKDLLRDLSEEKISSLDHLIENEIQACVNQGGGSLNFTFIILIKSPLVKI